MQIPLDDHLNYVGIDPGFTGAIGRINQAGTILQVIDIPLVSQDKKQRRELDLPKLECAFESIAPFPDVFIGIEKNTTRIKDSAESSFRFGRGTGILEAFIYLMGFESIEIPPNLWKPRLGLPGKQDRDATKKGAALLEAHYPDVKNLIYGPRGGLKDGRVDALLIAHFMRTHAKKLYCKT